MSIETIGIIGLFSVAIALVVFILVVKASFDRDIKSFSLKRGLPHVDESVKLTKVGDSYFVQIMKDNTIQSHYTFQPEYEGEGLTQ